jgi:hypothetical protein
MSALSVGAEPAPLNDALRGLEDVGDLLALLSQIEDDTREEPQ